MREERTMNGGRNKDVYDSICKRNKTTGCDRETRRFPLETGEINLSKTKVRSKVFFKKGLRDRSASRKRPATFKSFNCRRRCSGGGGT